MKVTHKGNARQVSFDVLRSCPPVRGNVITRGGNCGASNQCCIETVKLVENMW